MEVTLSGMRATLSSMRRMLGRGWEYKVTDGHSRQLAKDHIMYNPTVPYRMNRIIVGPTMTCNHKKIGFEVYVEINETWGDIRMRLPNGVRVEMLEAEKAVETIKQEFGNKTWIF